MGDFFGAVVNAGHLTKKLVVYCNQVKSASTEIERLRKQVELANITVEEFGHVLQEIPLDDRSDAKFREWIEILRPSTESFVGLCQNIEAYFPTECQAEGRFRRTVRHLKWPKDKKRLDGEMRQTREYVAIVQAFLSVKQARSRMYIDNSIGHMNVVMEETLAKLEKGDHPGIRE